MTPPTIAPEAPRTRQRPRAGAALANERARETTSARRLRHGGVLSGTLLALGLAAFVATFARPEGPERTLFAAVAVWLLAAGLGTSGHTEPVHHRASE